MHLVGFIIRIDVAILHSPLSRGVKYTVILLELSSPVGCTKHSPSVTRNYIYLMAIKSVTSL